MTLAGLLDLGYPKFVVSAVDAVSLRAGEEYDHLIERAASHPLGCLVKLADNLDNSAWLPELSKTDPGRAVRLGAKYAKARKRLMSALVDHEAEAQRAGILIGGPAMVPA
jgi:hypothetical protein